MPASQLVSLRAKDLLRMVSLTTTTLTNMVMSTETSTFLIARRNTTMRKTTDSSMRPPLMRTIAKKTMKRRRMTKRPQLKRMRVSRMKWMSICTKTIGIQIDISMRNTSTSASPNPWCIILKKMVLNLKR